ncbi:hypothetical protein ASG31_12530 [Chryseobacterium sp. Leaf404]|nr:hypothetical protein ASG31_12530 [Chryseobacterium sp. Leaf404]
MLNEVWDVAGKLNLSKFHVIVSSRYIISKLSLLWSCNFITLPYYKGFAPLEQTFIHKKR